MKKYLLLIVLLFTVFASSAFAFCDIGNAIDIKYDDGIYHIILDGKKVEKKLEFVAGGGLMTNKEMHLKSGSMLTVNAGYFDPKNQKTISYIVNDRQTLEDPLFNENLLMNPVLRQNIDKIVDRTEFRVVECSGKYHYEIVSHKAPVDFTCSIITSAQGGPLIVPELRLEEEFFILKNAEGKIIRESTSVLEKTARTIIGIKEVNNQQQIHILIITNKNPQTIYGVRDLCVKLGLDRAMAFDGGSSTSLNYKKSIDVVSTSDAGGRMLKSFLVIRDK